MVDVNVQVFKKNAVVHCIVLSVYAHGHLCVNLYAYFIVIIKQFTTNIGFSCPLLNYYAVCDPHPCSMPCSSGFGVYVWKGWIFIE